MVIDVTDPLADKLNGIVCVPACVHVSWCVYKVFYSKKQHRSVLRGNKIWLAGQCPENLTMPLLVLLQFIQLLNGDLVSTGETIVLAILIERKRYGY